jgi:DNA-binding transcriptional ArsR family regulator
MSLIWREKPAAQDENGIAPVFQALGHPKRLQILRILQARGPLRCGELVPELNLAQSTVSQHLGILTQAGLVERDPGGGERKYRLRQPTMIRARQYLTDL